LSVVVSLVSVKMLLVHMLDQIDTLVSLGVVGTMLAVSVGAPLWRPERLVGFARPSRPATSAPGESGDHRS
jgi:hypothetical protein